MKPYVVAGIFARGGSKGVPRKNMRLVAGIPLVGHAVMAAKGTPSVDYVFVSTDDQEIAEAGRKYGADIPFMRPAELAADRTPEHLAWQHAVTTLQRQYGRTVDILVAVPATAPLRTSEEVEACVQLCLRDDTDVALTVTETHLSPQFNMVTIDESGLVKLGSVSDTPVYHRQTAQKLWAVTTAAFAIKGAHLLRTTRLHEGRVRAITIRQERAIDIDSLFDLEIADYLMCKRMGLIKT